MDLEHHSHGYGQCAYHIVLVPRYRHRVFLDARIQKRCADMLRDIAAEECFAVHELKVAIDHVHIFLSLTPTCPLPDAIGLLKCNSARRLFSEFPELRKQFWSGHFW